MGKRAASWLGMSGNFASCCGPALGPGNAAGSQQVRCPAAGLPPNSRPAALHLCAPPQVGDMVTGLRGLRSRLLEIREYLEAVRRRAGGWGECHAAAPAASPVGCWRLVCGMSCPSALLPAATAAPARLAVDRRCWRASCR